MATSPSTNNKSPVFNVRRGEPELITPAEPTPHEFKQLSYIDECHQDHIPLIQFYRNVPSIEGKYPFYVIKKAIADALVFYYPFAGRLREGVDKKMEVECNGEGILFMEADAEVTIDRFGDPILPPFPCLEKLVFFAPSSVDGVSNCPFLLMQVTRFQCGGFVVTANISHVMSDGPGAMQFVTAIGEIACGAQIPSILPVWERHMFNLLDLPHRENVRQEFEHDFSNDIRSKFDDIIYQSFFFGTSELSAIRSLVPDSLRGSSSFELLTACLWKYRAIALRVESDKEMSIMIAINARDKFSPPLVPRGYYGNGHALTMATATAREICENSLTFSLQLIKKAKEDVLKEFMQHVKRFSSVLEMFMATGIECCVISDLRHSGMEKVDYGWGKAVFAGPAIASPKSMNYIAYQNKKGENGILVPICLPSLVMKRFVEELNKGLNKEVSVITSQV